MQKRESIILYFNIIQDLQSVGRVNNPLECKMEEIKKSAERMLENGWATEMAIASTETYICNVPSERNPHVVYSVLQNSFAVVQLVQVDVCKHLFLLSLLTSGGPETFPDMDTQLQGYANELIRRKKYSISEKPQKTIEV